MSARAKPPLCPLCGTVMEWKNAGRTPTMHLLFCQGCGLASPYGSKKDVLKKFEPILNLKKEATK